MGREWRLNRTNCFDINELAANDETFRPAKPLEGQELENIV